MKTAAKTVERRWPRGYSGNGKSSPKATYVAPNNPKKLTAKERRTDKGRFAVHLAALLKERSWDAQDLADHIGLGVHAVRRWLRAEVMPSDLDMLQTIGRALDTTDHPMPDYRMVLPPPKR
jgi:hypothetical protein